MIAESGSLESQLEAIKFKSKEVKEKNVRISLKSKLIAERSALYEMFFC